MDKIQKLATVTESDFKRLVGVKRNTFHEMVSAYESYLLSKSKKQGIGGRKPLLSPAFQVLFLLEYYREYRSLKHQSFDYNISEPTASRVVKEVEIALIKSEKFSLPGRKIFQDEGVELSIAVIDVTEIAIERPKKTKKSTIQENKKSIQ
jgi:hypothetical protein